MTQTKVTIGEATQQAYRSKPYFVNVTTHVDGGVLKGGSTSVEVHRFPRAEDALAFATEKSA
ncbi:MAG TPA: hypothetical protein VI300_32140 [Solirubrobacter sp.]